MKKIFIVTRAKDESDIIESFCRYNLAYCDGMLMNDSGSYDNTKEIIQKLMEEGLPIYWHNGSQLDRAHIAVEQYGADLVIPLDTDEFLYHTEGVNPRETLEVLSEDVEYQALWRTYVYEKEPDITLGFMPNNFTRYRNPEMENPKVFERHKKVIASKVLLKDKQATFAVGAHFLKYPAEHQGSVDIEIHSKLVFAHFPVRSRIHIMQKVIPNWIYKWNTIHRIQRDALDNLQLGVSFNIIRDNGDITHEELKQYSLEYAMCLDGNISDEIRIFSRDEIDKMKNGLGENLTIHGPMDASFCADKLKLRYTDYQEDPKVFIRAVLSEIDKTVTFLSSESDERAMALREKEAQKNELNDRIRALNDRIREIYESNTWKTGKKINRIFRFFIPHKKK